MNSSIMSKNRPMNIASTSNDISDLKRKRISKGSPILESKTSRLEAVTMRDEEQISLTNLPNELIERIFDFVSFDDLLNLESTNKRISNIVKKVVWPKKHSFTHESIIRHTDYRQIVLFEIQDEQTLKDKKPKSRHNITKKSVEAIFSRTNIHHLDLSVYYQTISKDVCELLPMIPQLRSLNLSFIHIPQTDLSLIASHCPLLEELSLEKCFKEDETEEGLQDIFISCPNLKYLNLGDNHILRGDSFPYIPTQLKYLNLSCCFRITENARKLVAERTAENLETMILECPPYILDLNEWLNQFKKLRFLEISVADNNTHFLEFSKLKNLEMIAMTGNPLVTVETLESLQFCPKLHTIDLYLNEHLVDIKVTEILKKCKNLRCCIFDDWPSITPNFIQFIQGSQIEYLALSAVGNISDETLKSFFTECDSIKFLEFGDMNTQTLSTITSLLAGECPPKRKNFLHLMLVDDEEFGPYLPSSCEWCKVYPFDMESEFTYLTDVKVQYQRERNEL